MKSIVILVMAFLLTSDGFAQKSKSNSMKQTPSAITAQYACPMHPEVVSDEAGKCSKCNMDLTLSKKEKMKKDVTNTFTCPMHKEVVSNHKGVCAKCKSALVADRKGSKQVGTVYTCTMHPEEKSNKSAKCPVCAMEMVKVKS